MIARWFGADLDYLSSRTAPSLIGLSLILTAVGFMLPLSDISRRRLWFSQYRAYRSLYPLWNAMQEATPEIALNLPVPWWDIELRLTRRITEISDGRLALRCRLRVKADHVVPDES